MNSITYFQEITYFKGYALSKLRDKTFLNGAWILFQMTKKQYLDSQLILFRV